MTYKLKLKTAIEESGLTIVEVSEKSGISTRTIHRIINQNDAMFSDLYALSETIGCSLEELYEQSETYDGIKKPRKIEKRERRQQRKADIHHILSTRMPDEMVFIAKTLVLDEVKAASRLWEGRLTERAVARINRKSLF